MLPARGEVRGRVRPDIENRARPPSTPDPLAGNLSSSRPTPHHHQNTYHLFNSLARTVTTRARSRRWGAGARANALTLPMRAVDARRRGVGAATRMAGLSRGGGEVCEVCVAGRAHARGVRKRGG